MLANRMVWFQIWGTYNMYDVRARTKKRNVSVTFKAKAITIKQDPMKGQDPGILAVFNPDHFIWWLDMHGQIIKVGIWRKGILDKIIHAFAGNN